MDKMCDINLNEETSEDNSELRRSLTSLDGWDFADNHEEPSEPPERPKEVLEEEKEIDEEVERVVSPPTLRPSFSPTESNISQASSVRETDQLSSYSLPGATLSFHQQPYSYYHHQPPSNYSGGYYGGPPPPQHGGPAYHPNHYQHYGNQPPPSQNPNFYQPIPQYHSNYPGYGAPSPGPGLYSYYPMQGFDQNRQRPYSNDPYSRPPHRFDPNTSSSSFERSFGPTSFPNSTIPAPPLNMAGGGYLPSIVPPAYPSAFSGNPVNNLPPGFVEWYKRYVRWYSATHGGNEAGGRRQRLTPPLYPVRHSRVTFGPLNQLVVADGQNIIIHHLQPSLIDVESKISISTWPGPLVIGATDKADVMEFVKAQDGFHQTIGEAIEVSIYDRQKKQIWQILKMLLQLNGNISGSDIAELLFYHNEAEFSTEENNEVNQFRRLLTLGQRKNALEFAAKNNLWDHFWTLTCLTLPRETLSYSNPPTAMMEAASKFINTTLNSQDALYILYRFLLNKLRTYYNKNVAKPLPISNLHHFTILLANECEINSVVPAASSELLNFIIALRNNDSQHLVSISPVASYEIDSKKSVKLDYSEELVFINEIFEYSRNCDEIIIDFIPYKVLFTCKLFDYGFINQSKKYCERIRQALNHYTNQSPGLVNYAAVNWDLVSKIIDDLESRITGSLVEFPSESYVASSDAVAVDEEPSVSEVSVDHLAEGVARLSGGIDEENVGSLVSSPRKSQTSSLIDAPIFPGSNSLQFQRPEPVSFISRPEPVSFISRPEPFNILSTQSSSPPTPTSSEQQTTSIRPFSPPSAPTPVNTFTPISFSDNFPAPDHQQAQQPPSSTPSQQQNFNQTASFNQSSNQFNSKQQNQTWGPRQFTNSMMSSVADDVATNSPLQTPKPSESSPWVTQATSVQSFVPFSQSSQPFQSQPQVLFQNQQQHQPRQQFPSLPQTQHQQQQLSQDFLESDQSQPMSYISVQTASYNLNRYEESETGQQSYKSTNHPNFNSTTYGLSAPSISTSIVSPIASPSMDYSQMRSNSSFDTTTTQQIYSNDREIEDKKSDDKDANKEIDTLDSKQAAKQKGVFDFLFSKLPSLPKRAVLPDDKDPSIIWDDKLQKWINKDEKDDSNDQNAPAGPPKIPIFNQSMGSSGHPLLWKQKMLSHQKRDDHEGFHQQINQQPQESW